MIKQYTLKNGEKRWYFKIYLGIDPITRKKKYTTRRGFKTKKEAKIAMSRLELQVQNKGIESLTKNSITFEEVYLMWLEQYKNTVQESTLVVQRRACELHILPLFGSAQIQKITLHFCQEQVNHWYSYYKKYNNLIGMTSQVFDYAIKSTFIESNPMINIIKPKRKRQIDEDVFDNYYSKDELTEFLDTVKNTTDPELFTMFRLLAFTGMRKGELHALRWRDIDFINNELSIKRTLTTGENNTLIFQPPKTKKGLRTITIDMTTMKQLRVWRIKQKEAMLKFGFKTDSLDQLLFPDEDNGPKYLDFTNHNFDKIIDKNYLRKITVHGLRHTHCSLLFESGASIKEVQDRLGHSDIKTTMNIYTHVTKKAKEKTADNFAKYMEG